MKKKNLMTTVFTKRACLTFEGNFFFSYVFSKVLYGLSRKTKKNKNFFFQIVFHLEVAYCTKNR